MIYVCVLDSADFANDDYALNCDGNDFLSFSIRRFLLFSFNLFDIYVFCAFIYIIWYVFAFKMTINVLTKRRVVLNIKNKKNQIPIEEKPNREKRTKKKRYYC